LCVHRDLLKRERKAGKAKVKRQKAKGRTEHFFIKVVVASLLPFTFLLVPVATLEKTLNYNCASLHVKVARARISAIESASETAFSS
jgi:hypothetical protein